MNNASYAFEYVSVAILSEDLLSTQREGNVQHTHIASLFIINNKEATSTSFFDSLGNEIYISAPSF